MKNCGLQRLAAASKALLEAFPGSTVKRGVFRHGNIKIEAVSFVEDRLKIGDTYFDIKQACLANDNSEEFRTSQVTAHGKPISSFRLKFPRGRTASVEDVMEVDEVSRNGESEAGQTQNSGGDGDTVGSASAGADVAGGSRQRNNGRHGGSGGGGGFGGSNSSSGAKGVRRIQTGINKHGVMLFGGPKGYRGDRNLLLMRPTTDTERVDLITENFLNQQNDGCFDFNKYVYRSGPHIPPCTNISVY